MALNRQTMKDVILKVERSLAALRFEEAAGSLSELIGKAEKAGEKKDLPDLLVMLGQIQCRFEAGLPRARATFDRAVSIKEKVGGPDHEDLFSIVTDAYAALRSSGRNEEALPFIERAAALWEKANGAEANREFVIILDNLASAHLLAKKLERADEIFQRAVALAGALAGSEPSLGALIQVNHLEVLIQQDRLDEAARVLAGLEPGLAKLDAPVAAQVHYRAAQVLHRRKDLAGARERLHRGIALLEALPEEQRAIFLRAQVTFLARVEEELAS